MAHPAHPSIYHIVHVDRLASVVAEGGLLSDSIMSQRGGTGTTIGMSTIKHRRLNLQVRCHPGDCVGEYVPFYFCPRSVMLYLIYKANHPELTYRSGQGPIVHLEASLYEAVEWAERAGKRWAFSLSNAGAYYAQFHSDLRQLDQVNWGAVAARDWQDPEIKEGKQAEFLMRDFFPWELVTRIGAASPQVTDQVQRIVDAAKHAPIVEARPDWYY